MGWFRRLSLRGRLMLIGTGGLAVGLLLGGLLLVSVLRLVLDQALDSGARRTAADVVELLDHVWDAGADTDPNVVEVYVGYLRRKIDQPYNVRSLQTVRGAGYRLVG